MKEWIEADAPQTIVSLIPKNAHSSIREYAPLGTVFPTKDEALKYKVRVGIVRHPMSRLYSMYRYLKHQHQTGATLLRDVPTATYEKFVDYTFHVENHHWQSQKELLTQDGVFIPTVTHRLEDLAQIWGMYFDRALKHLNPSPTSYEYDRDYRIEELLTRYRDDRELWTISENKDGR